MKWLMVGLAMFVMDFVWARYTTAIADKAAAEAAGWSVAIILLSGYVTSSYVSDPWLLAPAAAGAFAGTFAAIRFDNRRKP